MTGQWTVEAMEGAPSGKCVLVQRATKNAYNAIVAPFGPYTDVDVSMTFKPISGREDASGGIVFRFADGTYYIVRANAREDNFRLYPYDRDRLARQCAGEAPGPRTVAHSPRGGRGRPRAGLARRDLLPRSPRLAVRLGAGGTVDEGRFDHGVR